MNNFFNRITSAFLIGLFSVISMIGQEIIPDNLVKFRKSANAYLAIEGAGPNGNYIVKGYASIEQSSKVIVFASGWTAISTNPRFGKVDYFGNAKLIINNIQFGKKNLAKVSSTIVLPDDGTQQVGATEFELPVNVNINLIEVEVEVGYIHESGFTPLPPTEKIRVKLYEKKEVKESTTLFLIDRSGSMASNGVSGKPKIEEAKEAAYHSLNSLQNNPNLSQEAGFLTFSGSCVDDPTASQALTFSSNPQQVQSAISSISNPGGGTPLKEAVDAATNRLSDYVTSKGSGAPAKLIVLSDGVSSCNKIRPSNIYATGTESLQKRNSPNNSAVIVKYYTIGFDIRPGSEAERDLQYLAQTSGGKYLNAQNEYELTRAFQRFFRVYIPKPLPAMELIVQQDSVQFQEGITKIYDETYDKAKGIFENLYRSYNKDYNIIFNLALMYDANNYYADAIKMYELYLMLNPKAKDYNWVIQQIELLKKDRDYFFKYTKHILTSDLGYLNLHFKKIQNGESLRLAEEFKGFIEEKKDYYKTLPRVLGVQNKQISVTTKEISRGLQNCSKLIKKEPENWDKNASPLLSMVYLNMKRLIESL